MLLELVLQIQLVEQKLQLKNKGTKTHAPLRVKAYLNLLSIFN